MEMKYIVVHKYDELTRQNNLYNNWALYNLSYCLFPRIKPSDKHCFVFLSSHSVVNIQQNIIKIFEMCYIRTVTTEKNKTKGTMENNFICKIKRNYIRMEVKS